MVVSRKLLYKGSIHVRGTHGSTNSRATIKPPARAKAGRKALARSREGKNWLCLTEDTEPSACNSLALYCDACCVRTKQHGAVVAYTVWCRMSRYLVIKYADAIQRMPVSPGARQRASHVKVAEHQSYQARHCCRVGIRQRPGNLLALQPEILPPATSTLSSNAWQG